MGRRRGSPAALLRGGARPELFELGVSGVNRAGVWVGKGLRDMRSPLEAFAGLGEVRGGVCYDGDGPTRRGSPARGVQAAGVRYGLKQLAYKHGGDLGVLTEAWNGRGPDAAGLAARSGGVAWTGVRGGVAAGALRVC